MTAEAGQFVRPSAILGGNDKLGGGKLLVVAASYSSIYVAARTNRTSSTLAEGTSIRSLSWYDEVKSGKSLGARTHAQERKDERDKTCAMFRSLIGGSGT
jgi:hypothetical protein